MSSHITGILGSQEQRGLCDFFGIAAPALRNAVLYDLDEIRAQALAHGRRHVSGTDGVDADIVSGMVEGHGAHEIQHAGLGRGVASHAVLAGQGGGAGGGDDDATFLQLHLRNRDARQVEERAEVRVDDLLELGEVVVWDCRHGGWLCCVVEEDVEAAMGGDACADCGFAVRRIPYVALEERCFFAVGVVVVAVEPCEDVSLGEVHDEDASSFVDELGAGFGAETG